MAAKTFIWVLLTLLVWPVSLSWAAESDEQPGTEATSADAQAVQAGKPMVRAALLPDTENMAAQLMPAEGATRGLDGYQWLDVEKQQGLLVHRAAYNTPGKGAALLVSADTGAHSGRSLLGQLRQSLPGRDWHSYLVGLPLQGRKPSERQAEVLGQRVTQAFELLQAAHPEGPVVVFGEGSVCEPLAALFAADGALPAAGLVLLNQPSPTVANGALSSLETPTLMLQVMPHRYPDGYPLAPAVELRQLPRVSPRQPKSLVIRQVQGWLRRFEPQQG